ncbi:unnamed protein product [Brassica napus]|uniref:(rape) hypothetical protein n=1 Tax=Brassica napus TaxID=3708 RepID=A0A816KNY6_BRANA|nr:unnamed protein product [Brassica napus]
MTRVELKERIDLTEKEQKMFDLLLDALRENNCDTRLRVAGGWYFYLFHFSNTEDIDIAIDNMTGSRFLEKFQNYFSRKVGEKVNVHIIKSKSKHLETGKMRLYDQWIDFEQLRKEEPDENSRIPTKYFGTPEEDAYRRDLTINRHVLSIFILFFTRTDAMAGIDDLKSGRTTTPSPAKTIFLEDPLRVRRAIRFGICVPFLCYYVSSVLANRLPYVMVTKFGFTLDEELKDAASSEEIRVALERKICRERIGNEIDMMISGNGPVSAVTYLSDFKLFEVVFAIPSSSEPAPTENCGSLCRAYMEAMWNLIQTPGLVNFNGEQRRLALFAAVFLPFRKTVCKDKKANKTCSLLHDAETVINIHNAAERFLPLILPLQLKDPFQLVNVDWATDVLEHWESISLNDPEVPATSKIRVVTGFFLEISKISGVFLNEKPLMKGDKIIKEVQNGGQVVAIQDSGPIIRDWQNKSLTWNLTYPKGSVEECISWMANRDC